MASRIFFFQPLPSLIPPAARSPHARAASPSSLHPKLPQLIIRSQRSIHGVNHPQFFDGLRRHRLNILSSRATDSDNSGPELSSPLEVIRSLHEAINLKDCRKLEGLVSDDCHFVDESYFKPSQGKKEAVSFFKELGSSVGSNVKLVVDHEHESRNHTVICEWHMEWRGQQIPFTKAHSFFECEADGKGHRIKQVVVSMEWPPKLWVPTSRFLVAVTSLFELLLGPAEWFLQNPHAPIAWLLKIYNTFIKPVVWPAFSPVIIFYTKLWNSMLYLASYLYGWDTAQVFPAMKTELC